MSKQVKCKPDAAEDQLICLNCGERERNRHNVPCEYCGVMMVFERAWANIHGPTQVVPESAPAQLALF